MLGILDGRDRYAHIGALRGDGVAPEVLGMGKIIGDDSLRRALAAIAPAPKAIHSAEERAAQQVKARQAEQWMQAQLRHSIAQAWRHVGQQLVLFYGYHGHGFLSAKCQYGTGVAIPERFRSCRVQEFVHPLPVGG